MFFNYGNYIQSYSLKPLKSYKFAPGSYEKSVIY